MRFSLLFFSCVFFKCLNFCSIKGLVAMNHLDLEIEIYFASEIDENANMVGVHSNFIRNIPSFIPLRYRGHGLWDWRGH